MVYQPNRRSPSPSRECFGCSWARKRRLWCGVDATEPTWSCHRSSPSVLYFSGAVDWLVTCLCVNGYDQPAACWSVLLGSMMKTTPLTGTRCLFELPGTAENSKPESRRTVATLPAVGGMSPCETTDVWRSWCDASSIALGVCIEIDGDIVEDKAWLRPADDNRHINVAELESAIRGLKNLAVSWNAKKLMLRTDSRTVASWLRDVVENLQRSRTKGLHEVFGQRRLQIVADLIQTAELDVSIGRNAATRVHSNPGSSADQFDWEGRKINGNRKKTPRKCPFQGRNLKVTTPEEGRGKEKVETCSVAVPSEVGFFWVQWRSSPHNLDQYRGKIEFSTLLADLLRHLNTIPHLRSLLQVSHDPNPRKKTPAEQYWRFPGAAKMLQLAKDLEIFHRTRHAKERKDRSSTSFSPPFELF